MRVLIIVIIVLTGFQDALCQQVISPAGATYQGSSIQLSWTLGETMSGTFTGTSVTLTQGFHQGKLSITSVEPDINSIISVSVYPNPVNDKLKIEFTEFQENKHCFELTDIKGSTILKGVILSSPHSIDMKSVKCGIYLLKVSTPLKNQWQTYKVIKQ